MKQLALDQDGNMSYCSVAPELRGTKGCTHTTHQETGELPNQFMERVAMVAKENDNLDRARKEFAEELKLVPNPEIELKEEAEALRTELSEYGITEPEVQEKVLKTIALARIEARDGEASEKGLSYYGSDAGTIALMLPEIDGKAASDLSAYVSLTFRENNYYGHPASLKDAGELLDDGTMEDAGWDLEEMIGDSRYKVL